jgi:hypothetical protein
MSAPAPPATATPPQYTAGKCKQDKGTSIANPTGLAVTAHATGGTLPAGATFWVVTALGANGGETAASNEVTATLTGTTSSADLTWPALTGSGGFNVYRGAAAGAEDILVATLGASALSYTDTGAAGTSHSPPATNTASTGTGAVAIRTNIVTTNNFKDWGVMTIDHGGHYDTWDTVQGWTDLT